VIFQVGSEGTERLYHAVHFPGTTISHCLTAAAKKLQLTASSDAGHRASNVWTDFGASDAMVLALLPVAPSLYQVAVLDPLRHVCLGQKY
jgi:hypothetical protein